LTRTNRAQRLAPLTVLAVVALLALAPAALAQSSSAGTYAGQGGGAAGAVADPGADPGGDPGASASVDPGGSLPFTGLDLVLAAGGGVALLAIGASMAHVLRRRTPGDPA
jgi:hypothetical protein